MKKSYEKMSVLFQLLEINIYYMIKFSKILESITIEEIEDYFLPINDVLESPVKKEIGTAPFIIYQFEWNLDFRIDEFNDINKIDKIIKCLETINELKTSQKRIIDYDIDFKIINKLVVRLTPREKGVPEEYNFIRQNWREVLISYSAVVRFFKSRGFSVIKIEEIDNSESMESSTVQIVTNADTEVCQEFCNFLDDELSYLDREVAFKSSNGIIQIYPISEKTYVVIKNR